jgi:predicted type IV restriction endonuclease
MKYYAETPRYFPTAQNKLFTATYAALKEYDRFIFSIKLLPVVKSSIENIIASLNAQNKRCSPLEPSWIHDGSSIKKEAATPQDIVLYLNRHNHYGDGALVIKLAREESDL